MNPAPLRSTRPYLVRAIYEWCSDNGLTPYVAVQTDDTVQVPREFVKNGQIVLNVSFDATQGLIMDNEAIRFKARFGGVPREIFVPIDRVLAIYARENGQGMAFAQTGPDETTSAELLPRATPTTVANAGSSSVNPLSTVTSTAGPAQPSDNQPPTKPSAGARPALKRIK